MFFFFFKQKTAYEMRISDWSSDVCSSDLHLAAAGGTAQFMAAAFDQQRAEPFEQSLVRLAEAGETEQTAQWLPEITDGLVRRDEGQARAFDGLFAVQPPQAIAQRQRLDLLQYTRKRSEEHTSELQSLMRTSYAVFCLKKKNNNT